MKLKLRICVLIISLSLFYGFASCTDDKEVMGAVAINSCQCSDTSVTVIWTLVPNSNCDGYIISLYSGTRTALGEMLEQKEFDYRTCECEFNGLQPETSYVISTQAKPSTSSGFSSAEIYWWEFTTTNKMEEDLTDLLYFNFNEIHNPCSHNVCRQHRIALSAPLQIGNARCFIGKPLHEI